MDEAELEAWLELDAAYRTECWERGDLDGLVSMHTDDYVQVSYRYMSSGYAEGRYAVEELWTFREFFPFTRIEPICVAPPDRAVGRVVGFDAHGNEMVSVIAVRYRDGLTERMVNFGEDNVDEAVAALDDLDAFDADPADDV